MADLADLPSCLRRLRDWEETQVDRYEAVSQRTEGPSCRVFTGGPGRLTDPADESIGFRVTWGRINALVFYGVTADLGYTWKIIREEFIEENQSLTVDFSKDLYISIRSAMLKTPRQDWVVQAWKMDYPVGNSTVARPGLVGWGS